MARTIGITTAEEIAAGLVDGHQLVGKLRIYQQGPEDEPLLSLPPEGIAKRFAEEIQAVAAGKPWMPSAWACPVLSTAASLRNRPTCAS